MIGESMLCSFGGVPMQWTMGLNGDVVMERVASMIRKREGRVVKKFWHKFKTGGYSVCLILAESHCAIHTWPERKLMTIDVFSCSDKFNLRDLKKDLSAFFKPETESVEIVSR